MTPSAPPLTGPRRRSEAWTISVSPWRTPRLRRSLTTSSTSRTAAMPRRSTTEPAVSPARILARPLPRPPLPRVPRPSAASPAHRRDPAPGGGSGGPGLPSARRGRLAVPRVNRTARCFTYLRIRRPPPARCTRAAAARTSSPPRATRQWAARPPRLGIAPAAEPLPGTRGSPVDRSAVRNGRCVHRAPRNGPRRPAGQPGSLGSLRRRAVPWAPRQPYGPICRPQQQMRPQGSSPRPPTTRSRDPQTTASSRSHRRHAVPEHPRQPYGPICRPQQQMRPQGSSPRPPTTRSRDPQATASSRSPRRRAVAEHQRQPYGPICRPGRQMRPRGSSSRRRTTHGCDLWSPTSVAVPWGPVASRVDRSAGHSGRCVHGARPHEPLRHVGHPTSSDRTDAARLRGTAASPMDRSAGRSGRCVHGARAAGNRVGAGAPGGSARASVPARNRPRRRRPGAGGGGVRCGCRARSGLRAVRRAARAASWRAGAGAEAPPGHQGGWATVGMAGWHRDRDGATEGRARRASVGVRNGAGRGVAGVRRAPVGRPARGAGACGAGGRAVELVSGVGPGGGRAGAGGAAPGQARGRRVRRRRQGPAPRAATVPYARRMRGRAYRGGRRGRASDAAAAGGPRQRSRRRARRCSRGRATAGAAAAGRSWAPPARRRRPGPAGPSTTSPPRDRLAHRLGHHGGHAAGPSAARRPGPAYGCRQDGGVAGPAAGRSCMGAPTRHPPPAAPRAGDRTRRRTQAGSGRRRSGAERRAAGTRGGDRARPHARPTGVGPVVSPVGARGRAARRPPAPGDLRPADAAHHPTAAAVRNACPRHQRPTRASRAAGRLANAVGPPTPPAARSGDRAGLRAWEAGHRRRDDPPGPGGG